jgi:hypothetical protein
VSNREVVALGLWPLPFVAETPLYLLALAGLVLGFVAGEAHAWIGRCRLKRELRRRAREIESLQRELAATQARLAQGQFAQGPIEGAAAPSRAVVPLRG